MTTYAVTGASGHLGHLTVTSLLDRGVPPEQVLALARTPDKVADLAARGVAVRLADYDRPDTLGPALAGVDVVLLVSGTDVGQRTAQHRAVIEAAEAAGVQRVVYTSVVRADDTQLLLVPEHAATEALLHASDLQFTILRNSWYIENYTDRIGQFLAQGQILGAAGETPFAGATRADYAKAATTVLVEDGHGAATYELGGTPFTMTDLAVAITDASGTPVTYRNVTSAELLAALQGAGIPDGYAGALVAVDEATARGELDTDSGDLQRLLGRASTPSPTPSGKRSDRATRDPATSQPDYAPPAVRPPASPRCDQTDSSERPAGASPRPAEPVRPAGGGGVPGRRHRDLSRSPAAAGGCAHGRRGGAGQGRASGGPGPDGHRAGQRR